MSEDYSPKTLPDLMKHLRENHSIQIKDEHTRQMLNYGYYHAYKGYRFFKKPSVIIPYTTFEQVLAVIDYDNDLKSALYPEMMFLETALKNIVVAYIIEDLPSAGIDMVMKKRMNDFPKDDELKRKRNHMKNNIYSAVQSRSQNNAVIEHFKNKNVEIPIWAIFEVISLGDFISFLSCLNFRSRRHLLSKLKIQSDNDIECQLL
ncbi:MAG: Abi family protein, partial [Oscillospiraceae bacterium]